MKKLSFILFLLALVGCRTTQVSNTPFSWTAPDSLDIDPALLNPVNGWEPFLVNSKTVIWLPPPVENVKNKVKNSHNTDNSQKNSNNTESKQKNSENTTAKGEAIIGDSNAPIEARKDAVVGDGNTVEQEEQSLWWLWVLAGVCLAAVGWAWWNRG